MATKSCIIQPTSPASVSSPSPKATLAYFNPLNMWCSFQCLGLCTFCSILLTHPANANLSGLSLNFVSSKRPSLITWVPCHMLTWHLNVSSWDSSNSWTQKIIFTITRYVTELRFSCSSLKHPKLRDKCWVKGKVTLLRKLAMGRSWTHVQRPIPCCQSGRKNF